MKCQRCNEREANTHIQKIVNGKKTEYYLCDKCAAESGEFNFSFGNDFDDFFGGFFGNTAKMFAPPAEKICGNCGLTLSQFLNSGKLGCSSCYENFSTALDKPLRQIHGAATHTGKIPRRGGAKISTEAKIKHLESKLSTAVANQEFEKAAKLRDEIKELKEGGKK